MEQLPEPPVDQEIPAFGVLDVDDGRRIIDDPLEQLLRFDSLLDFLRESLVDDLQLGGPFPDPLFKLFVEQFDLEF